MCLGMGDGIVGEVAVPMLTMRLIANSYKGGSGSASAAGSLMDRYVTHALQSPIGLSSSSLSLTHNSSYFVSLFILILEL